MISADYMERLRLGNPIKSEGYHQSHHLVPRQSLKLTQGSFKTTHDKDDNSVRARNKGQFTDFHYKTQYDNTSWRPSRHMAKPPVSQDDISSPRRKSTKTVPEMRTQQNPFDADISSQQQRCQKMHFDFKISEQAQKMNEKKFWLPSENKKGPIRQNKNSIADIISPKNITQPITYPQQKDHPRHQNLMKDCLQYSNALPFKDTKITQSVTKLQTTERTVAFKQVNDKDFRRIHCIGI